MFEEFADEFEKHRLILVRIIEPRFEESQGCSAQSFDEASRLLGSAEARIPVTFCHKGPDEADELERVAVIGDGEGRLCCRKLVELSRFSYELSHGGPNFMGTELGQCCV